MSLETIEFKTVMPKEQKFLEAFSGSGKWGVSGVRDVFLVSTTLAFLWSFLLHSEPFIASYFIAVVMGVFFSAISLIFFGLNPLISWAGKKHHRYLTRTYIPALLHEMSESDKPDIARLGFALSNRNRIGSPHLSDVQQWVATLRQRVENGVPLPPNFLCHSHALYIHARDIVHPDVDYLDTSQRFVQVSKMYSEEMRARRDERGHIQNEEDLLPVSMGLNALQDMLRGGGLRSDSEYYQNSLNALESLLHGLREDRESRFRRPVEKRLEVALMDKACVSLSSPLSLPLMTPNVARI